MFATLDLRLPVAGFLLGLGPIASPLPFDLIVLKADRLGLAMIIYPLLCFWFDNALVSRLCF